MASTTTSPNNKSVTFRGKPEREMANVPNVPKPPRMNAEDQPVDGPKPAIKKIGANMRKGVKRAMKRGMISEKAAKKHLGGSY